MQELDRLAATGECSPIHQLFPKDIEDIVVKNEEAILRGRMDKAAKGKQNVPKAKNQQTKQKDLRNN